MKEKVKIILTIVEIVLFFIAMIIYKIRPYPQFEKPMQISTILQAILYVIVLILGIIVVIWNMISLHNWQ